MATTAPASRPSRWPWIVLGVTVAFAAIGLVFVSLNGYSLLGDATNFIAFMGMGIVGALSLSRAPDNRIGWLLLWVAVTVGAAFTTGEASIYAAAHGEDALAGWLAWPGNALWTLGLFPLLILLPLVFPDGRLPSPRWRWLAWAGIGISFLAFITIGFGEATFEVGDVGQSIMIANPLHVPGLDLLGPIESVIWPLLLGLFAAAAASMVVRFRRSRGVERQQLKWFAFAVVVLVTYFVISAVLEGLGVSEGAVGEVISGLAFLGIPVTVGIAILQYRLWDLDVVVKKTFVAGTVVVLALAVYAGAVALVGAITVENERPALLFAIALGLGIAFRPAMRIGRRVADRRGLRQARHALRGPDRVLRARRRFLRDGGRSAADGAGPRRGLRGRGGARVAPFGPPPPPSRRVAGRCGDPRSGARLRRRHGRPVR